MPPPFVPPFLGPEPPVPPMSEKELKFDFEKVAHVITNTESKMNFFMIKWFFKLLVNIYFKFLLSLNTKPSL